MFNVSFIKQIKDGKGVFSSLFNLVNYQSRTSLKSRSIRPWPKLSFFMKSTRIRLILVSFFELWDLMILLACNKKNGILQLS